MISLRDDLISDWMNERGGRGERRDMGGTQTELKTVIWTERDRDREKEKEREGGRERVSDKQIEIRIERSRGRNQEQRVESRGLEKIVINDPTVTVINQFIYFTERCIR